MTDTPQLPEENPAELDGEDARLGDDDGDIATEDYPTGETDPQDDGQDPDEPAEATA